MSPTKKKQPPTPTSSPPTPAPGAAPDAPALDQAESPPAHAAAPAAATSGRSVRRRASRARTAEDRLIAIKGRALARLTPAKVQLRTVLAQTRFLREFSLCGNVLRAAQAAGVGRRVIYSWRAEDSSFDQKMAEAHEDALDALEEEARRRGVDGVLDPCSRAGTKSAPYGSTATTS